MTSLPPAKDQVFSKVQLIYTEFGTSYRFRGSAITIEATLPSQASLHIFKLRETPQV